MLLPDSLAYALEPFCSRGSLWTLCHTSRNLRKQFIQIVLGKCTQVLNELIRCGLCELLAPYITKLLVYDSFNRESFPKLNHLVVISNHLIPSYLTNIITLAWCPTTYEDREYVSKCFQWPPSLTRLTLGLGFMQSVCSYPPNLSDLTVHGTIENYSLLPASLTSLEFGRSSGVFLFPQCTNLTKLTVNGFKVSVLSPSTFPPTLTYLKLPDFNGLGDWNWYPSCLQILKLPSLKQLIPIPPSIIHLTLGFDAGLCFQEFDEVRKKEKWTIGYWVYKKGPPPKFSLN